MEEEGSTPTQDISTRITFRVFLWLCLKMAFRHNKSVLDLASLVVGILVPLLGTIYRYYGVSGQEDSLNDLVWEVIGGVCAAIVALRLVASPFWVYQETCAKQTEKLTKAAKEIAEWNAMYRPQLVLACDSGTPGCKVSEEGGVDFNQVFRVEVRSRGFNPVNQCRGTLLRIEKNAKELWANNPSTLTFARADKTDSTCKTIDLTGPQYLEVVGIIKKENGFRQFDNCVRMAVNAHQRELSPSLHGQLTNAGKFLITIAVSGHSSVPVIGELSFDWTGDYDTSSLTLIKQYPAVSTPQPTPNP